MIKVFVEGLTNHFLTEAPLPDDWDHDIFDSRQPFRKRVEYAKARAQQVGRGSSRVVFIIPYQGRNTALKIALNPKGLAQNEAEAQLLEDWYLRNTGLVIPLIDYDEKGSKPVWIHTELAEKITKQQLTRFLGGAAIEDIIAYAEMQMYGRKKTVYGSPEKVDVENELVSELIDVMYNYNGTIEFSDLRQKANWGLYKRKPVIIDLGLTPSVYDQYYKRR